jgi:hypothetical protein
VSGPLASWVAEHSKADTPAPRAVLVQLALAAKHDGTPAHPPTWDDLARRSSLDRRTVGKCLAQLRRLGEVLAEDGGGGRGRATRYHVVFAFCPAEAACWSCGILADVQKQWPERHGFEPVNAKRNRAPRARKGGLSNRNRVAQATHNGTGDGTPPQGGTVTHPESKRSRSRRPSADAAAAPARVREQPIGPATAAVEARGLALLAEIRKFDRDAEFNPAIAGFRVSDAWCKRYGGFSGIPLDKAERWLAWAAEQVAGEQARMQAASRHRLANPVAVADVLDEPGQERGAAS